VLKNNMATSSELSLSVVVPTRNRPDQVVACAAALLRCEGLREAVFVDQSDDDKTQQAIAAVGDSRVRCERSALRGATNGRNVGIASTTGSLIAFTDDDCRPAVDWLTRIEHVFREDSAAGVVCGRVWVPAELLKQGFAAGFEPNVREWVGRFPSPNEDWGITANLAARRSVFEQLGTFDPLLGPGAPLRCGEEPDFLFRVLRAGMKVVNAREVEVEHLGVRPHGAASAGVLKDYAAGTAAAFLKHVRLGDLDGASIYLKHLAGCGHLILTNLAHLHRPVGFGYTLAFLSGSVSSLRYRVDKKARVYTTS
jgi:glycosyltransferase involved in cell wall biosynthesis